MEQLSIFNKITDILCKWIKSEKIKNNPENIDRIIKTFEDYYGKDYVDVTRNSNEFSNNILEETLRYQLFLYRIKKDPDTKLITEDKYIYNLMDLLESDYPNFLKLKMVRKMLVDIKGRLKFLTTEDIKIVVHIPEKEVINENNESTTIYDVYVRIDIQVIAGNLPSISNFSITRGTYTEKEIDKGYIHSHLPAAACAEDFITFRKPCLGTSPLSKTVSTLSRIDENYDMELWNLFVLELDLFLGTESLDGIPYISLKRLKEDGSNFLSRSFESNAMVIHKEFKHMITSVLPELLNKDNLIGYNGCSYFLTESLEEFIININKAFKEKSLSISILKKCECILNDKGEIIIVDNTCEQQEKLEEIKKLSLPLIFKNKNVHIQIKEFNNTKVETFEIYDCPHLYRYLYKSIMDAINIKNINHA